MAPRAGWGCCLRMAFDMGKDQCQGDGLQETIGRELMTSALASDSKHPPRFWLAPDAIWAW